MPPIPSDQVSPDAVATRGPPANALAYRINDAVQISGLGRTTIYKLIGDNRLRSIVVAGRRLVLATSLRELLEAA